jgi:LysR family transcriptional regulator, nitrogen assimilation regulatory protein
LLAGQRRPRAICCRKAQRSPCGGRAINLRQLKYFCKIVEVGNITRAAEQLHVAQPALGLQIRLLEADLKTQLLVRHSRGVTPTSAGEILYARARDILTAIQRARVEVLNLEDRQRETINVGLSPGLMNLLGGSIIERAPVELPSLQLNLQEQTSTALVDAIEKDEIDIAIASDAPVRETLRRIPVINEELLLVTAVQEKPACDPIRFDEVVTHPLVLGGPRASVRQAVQSEAKKRGIALKKVTEVSSVTIMKRLVARGGVATIMPVTTVLDELRRNELTATRIEDPVFRRTTCVVHSARRAPTEGEEALIRFLQTLIALTVRGFGELAIGVAELHAGAVSGDAAL